MVLYGLSVIVFMSVLTMAMPVSAQPTANELGVYDAMGNPNTYVKVPVNITNTQNGPIAGIGVDIAYNTAVIGVVGIQVGSLTSGWDFSTAYINYSWGTRVSIVYGGSGTEIIDGSTGSVALLNFSVIGNPGETSAMNLSNIQLSDLDGYVGTAPPKNGTFRVDAGAPSVTNPTANPDTIVANGTDKTELNVTVVDDIAVDVVTIDLTPIGGAVTTMKTIDTTLYSTNTTAPIGTPAGTYYLQVNATDLLGNYNNTENFTLIVEAPETGSITGKITYTCNTAGIADVTVNLTGGSIVTSTATDSDGNYTFNDVTPGDYYVNASKSRFWDNSTEVTVTAGERATADMMLWLKGDLNDNCDSADIGDLLLMKRTRLGEITGDWRYDLNNNGENADIGDLLLMKRARLGEIILT